MIELQNITVTTTEQPETVLLQNINLSIMRHSFTVIIGPNGAGKSTFLNALSGYIPIKKGKLIFDGHDITHMPCHKRAAWISRVFQNPQQGLAHSFSVEENLALAQKRGLQKTLTRYVTNHTRAHWKELLCSMQLDVPLKQVVSSLSGGQQQVLSLIMTTLNTPNLILLDEHVAALDPRSSAHVLDATEKIIALHKLTTIMITHNLKHALRFGDRLILINKGRIVKDLSFQEKHTLTVETLKGFFHGQNP